MVRITLATLHAATAQQVFEQVRDHLLRQMKRSMLAPTGPMCAYLSHDGLTTTASAVFDELRAEGGLPRGPFSDLNKHRAEHIWKHAKKRAGITERECVIHSLRHTCATRLLKATGNIALVKDWLGHTTIKTTADTYAHVETDSLMDGAAALAALRGTSLANMQASKDSNS